jgi:Family of unknown function (DUF6526)
MSEKIPQTFKNHGRFDPLFHFFLVPVAAITMIASIWKLIQNPNMSSGWRVVIALAAVVAVFKIRLYALRVQDRVIRVEERQRLGMLLPEALRSKIGQLSEPQLIALRFASDGEVAGLVEKTLANNLAPKQIKEAIVTWRPDYFRV